MLVVRAGHVHVFMYTHICYNYINNHKLPAGNFLVPHKEKVLLCDSVFQQYVV